MKSLHTISIFLLVLLSGCASNMAQAPDLVAPSAGKAVIYVYRVDLSLHVDNLVPNVRINQESIGPLTRRGYFRVEVSPGTTQVALYPVDRGFETFWPTAQNAIVSLNLAADSTHFVELAVNTNLFSFKEASRDKALQAISGLYLLK